MSVLAHPKKNFFYLALFQSPLRCSRVSTGGTPLRAAEFCEGFLDEPEALLHGGEELAQIALK